MNKKSALFLGLIVAIVLIISYCHTRRDAGPEGTEPAPETLGTPAEQITEAQNFVKAEPPPMEAPAAAASSGFLPTEMEDPHKFELYQQKIKEMGACLNMIVKPLDPGVEVNFDTFNQSINEDLGDIVTQDEEWVTTDLRTKDGELRRLYLERMGDPEGSRSLQYFAYASDGSRKELPLSKEQKINPTETLLASLEADGEVVGRSVSRRIFYQNGDDLLLVEKNGKIFSFQLVHEGTSYRCTGADKSSTFQCQCK
ncbi:hypothetical protein EZJ49_03505 [Bdellovibrio bacteriovorus]|uniref:hypothetical protein n=1 Tax=Bdellovibrio bacteriovorus TaxID=959 RepID=UPI0021D03AA7|nr:hypothetical protein [Bdellovibrio bacteriovorus]UXR65316.1 hypothetical protein EZJ49_03505 [Bdellovibrio bacteriovorus]